MPSILNATTTNGLVTSADNSGSLQLQTNNGTTAVTIDTSQNVGIGTSSPASFGKLAATGVSNFGVDQTDYIGIQGGGGTARIDTFGGNTNINLAFSTKGTGATYFWRGGYGGTASMIIDGSGFIGINANPSTSGPASGRLFVSTSSGNGICSNATVGTGYRFASNALSEGGTFYHMNIIENGTQRGSITSNGSATAYNTTSDYRLKENIEPIAGALAKISQLKPCTYTWKSNGSAGEGFIAHELQALIPQAVTGEKDAVDENGEPKYQMVDTSFLVATLTAAIQELKAELDATKAEVQALKGVA